MAWLDSYHIPFSWSYSRAELYAECRRKYYWRYYAPYGGNTPWERGDRALIYTLGRLTTLPMLIGSITHDLARDSLRSAAAGRAWLPAAYAASARALLDAGLRRSEKAARALRGAAQRQNTPGKGTVLLDTHYYGEPWSPADLDAALTAAAHYAEALRDHPLYQYTLAQPSDLLAADQFDAFRVSDTPVYAVPDAVQRLGNNRLRLVDWKTGRTVVAHAERHARQLLVYALYARSKWGVATNALECWIADLSTGESVSVSVDDEALRQMEDGIVASIAEMRALLRDSERNQAHADEFPMLSATQEEAADGLPPAACRRCMYRLACYGDGSRRW